MRIQLSIVLAIAGTAGCINAVDEGNVMGAGAPVGNSDEQAMTAKCASGPTVKGIDVSTYQGSINWSRVADSGVKYAFIRVSDGTGYHDSRFTSNWSGAKAHGVLRGAYQFFEPNQDPVAQADLLIAKVGGHLGADDLPPVVDVESADGQSAHTIATKVHRWLERIHDKLGVQGIVYTGPYFWADSVGGADLNQYKLWVAHYGTQCPLVPPTWTHWTFHQFTSSGSISGISGGVDTDHFNGTLAELKDLTAGPQFPHACETHHFHGAFCDDENTGGEDAHDRLKSQLDVSFHCGNKAGSPAFCPNETITRSQMIYVLGKAARMPTAGHPNAFHDDNHDPHEAYFDAAHAYGIIGGHNGAANPEGIADRDQLATVLYRMYDLQDVNHDYFFDDDGDANEHIHNAVAAAGLMSGYNDTRHVRNEFKGSEKGSRSMLATLAVRAHDHHLVAVWNIPQPCKSGNFNGAFCDDDDNGSEAAIDRLHGELDVAFSCGSLGGSPAFCPAQEATRAETMYVLGKAAGIPTTGFPDAFNDDDANRYEKFLDAAKHFGVMMGWSGGKVKPNEIATRNTLAVVLTRMYALPPTSTDYFSDDDGAPNEDEHNRCAEAGLITGYDDGNGGRKFEADHNATRSMLATLATRAADHGLVAIWH